MFVDQQLIAVIERGEILANQISPAHRQKLLGHANAAIQSRAARLFTAVNADRAKVIQQYEKIMKTAYTPKKAKGIAKRIILLGK